MSSRLEKTVQRRRIYFYCLVFLLGMVAGGLLAVVGMRYYFMRFRPMPETIARERADRIQKDFQLSEEVKEKIYQANVKHFEEIQVTFKKIREQMGATIKRYAEGVAPLMPDEERRTRWLETYEDYFPKAPPPPPPPRFFGGPPPGRQ